MTAHHGYIANIVTSDTPHCEGTSHPWVIQVAPGQQVNLTLYDFALNAAYSTTSLRKNSLHHHQQPSSASSLSSSHVAGGMEMQTEVCRQYGLLQDGDKSPTPICGGNSRITHLLLSSGDVVKIWVTAGALPKDLKRFVIEYSGKASVKSSYILGHSFWGGSLSPEVFLLVATSIYNTHTRNYFRYYQSLSLIESGSDVNRVRREQGQT